MNLEKFHFTLLFHFIISFLLKNKYLALGGEVCCARTQSAQPPRDACTSRTRDAHAILHRGAYTLPHPTASCLQQILIVVVSYLEHRYRFIIFIRHCME